MPTQAEQELITCSEVMPHCNGRWKGQNPSAHCITKIKSTSLHHPLAHHLLPFLSPSCHAQIKNNLKFQSYTQLQPVSGGISHPWASSVLGAGGEYLCSKPAKAFLKFNFHPHQAQSGPSCPAATKQQQQQRRAGLVLVGRKAQEHSASQITQPHAVKRRNPLTTNAIRLFTVDSQRKQLQRNCIVFHIAMVIFFTRSTFLDKIW